MDVTNCGRRWCFLTSQRTQHLRHQNTCVIVCVHVRDFQYSYLFNRYLESCTRLSSGPSTGILYVIECRMLIENHQLHVDMKLSSV